MKLPILITTCLMTLLACHPTCMAAPLAPSDETTECLACHESLHPGLVEAWRKSKHAQAAPEGAKASVGCAECHARLSEAHPDGVDHNGFTMHPVVTPKDCAQCHQEAAEQYAGNLMAHAYENLDANPVYKILVNSISGIPAFEKSQGLSIIPPDMAKRGDSCYHCHGTKVEVKGTATRETDMGEMEFPVLTGWPNNGVGRVNPDGSLGSCSACHTRHSFSLAEARKPTACKECHAGPDAASYKVYGASKHGHTYESHKDKWNFEAKPWVVGRDFTGPTCAACHISQLDTPEGETLVKRSHKMTDRLPWRIFGLVYAHPQPKEPRTSLIKNADGLSLPVSLDNRPASDFLITPEEMAQRKETLQTPCKACHSTAWVDGHWTRFENVIEETNNATLAATGLMAEIWAKGYAKGLPDSPFDEAVERKWEDVWLLYANSIRLSAAMGAGGDYGVFADGRHWLHKRISEMHAWMKAMDEAQK